MTKLGAMSSNSGEVMDDLVEQLTGVVLWPWVASSSFYFLLFPFFFLSSSPSFLSLLSLFSVLLDVVNENEGGREVKWLVERVYMWV